MRMRSPFNVFAMATSPGGTLLYHERETQFPADGTHPSYTYNWYSTT